MICLNFWTVLALLTTIFIGLAGLIVLARDIGRGKRVKKREEARLSFFRGEKISSD